MSETSGNIEYSGQIFLNELMRLSTDLVWKNLSEAKKYETIDNAIEREEFMAANRGLLNFDLIHQFTLSSLMTAGLTHDVAEAAVENKDIIPENARDACAKAYINELLQTDTRTGKYLYYVEQNNYYRMLNGLPGMEDMASRNFIYNTKYSRYPMDIPVHEMEIGDRYELEALGYFDELLTQNPTKKYLRHLGQRCIPIYTARSAERFDILWSHTAESPAFQKDFEDTYSQTAYMINAVYYSPALSKSNPLYENFLAMAVLFITIQKMHYKYLNADITRDFYDTESLKYVYNSYKVPFYPSIPLEYHQKIVKQINQLISYKGSTQVFFDLFELFGLGDMDIYAYYLVKSRRFNADGLPVFAKKDDGTPDLQAMYDVAFSKVKLYNDPALEIADTANLVEYGSLTASDPYWVNDKELIDKIYSEKFNYTESKYIGIQTVFDIAKITAEYAYFLKLVQDNKPVTDLMVIEWDLVPNRVSLYDLFVYLGALYCNKFGYAGNIATDLPMVGKVLGYNFKMGLNTLLSNINDNDYLRNDTKLITLVKSMNVDNLASVDKVFNNINSMKTLLANKMGEAKTVSEYFAYRDLYNTIMVSELEEDAFRMTTGEVAPTYKDLLHDTSPDCYNRFVTIGAELVNHEIENVIAVIEKNVPSLRYLENSLDMNVSNIIENLFRILKFFKSAKSELVGYNIVYVLSHRGENFFKLLDKISYMHRDSEYDQDFQLFDQQYRHTYEEDLNSDSAQLLMINTLRKHWITLKDEFKALVDDYIEYIEYLTSHNDLHYLYDFIMDEESAKKIKDYLILDEGFVLLHEEIGFKEWPEVEHEPLVLFDTFIEPTPGKATFYEMYEKFIDVEHSRESERDYQESNPAIYEGKYNPDMQYTEKEMNRLLDVLKASDTDQLTIDKYSRIIDNLKKIEDSIARLSHDNMVLKESFEKDGIQDNGLDKDIHNLTDRLMSDESNKSPIKENFNSLIDQLFAASLIQNGYDEDMIVFFDQLHIGSENPSPAQERTLAMKDFFYDESGIVE